MSTLIKDSEKKLDRLYGSVRNLGKISPGKPAEDVLNAISDDINTPKALSELFVIVKKINNAKSDDEANELASILIGSSNLLGLMKEDSEQWFGSGPDVDESLINQLIMDREEARSNKDYDKADQIREQIESLGISIEDSASGTQWKK